MGTRQPRKSVLVRLTHEEATRLADLAREAGRSRNDVVRQIIRKARVSDGVEPVTVPVKQSD
jgi:predicted DNA-binding protein